MNPKDFSWTEDQQVTVTNPTSQDYKFKVHNKEYQLGAGKSAKMPGYIAWLYVYNMAVILVQQDGFFNRWNELEFRQEYYDKVVSGADPVMQDIEVQEQSPIQELEDQPEVASDTPSAADASDGLADEEGDEPEPAAKVEPMKPKAKLKV